MVRWDIRVPRLGRQKEDQRKFEFILISTKHEKTNLIFLTLHYS